MSGGLGVTTLLASYRAPGCYDELFGFRSEPLPHCVALCDALQQLSGDEWQRRAAVAERVFHDVGVTFTLTADEAGVERTIPFDPVPRVVAAAEWAELARGLFQRVRALNAFLWDVYHEQRCVRDGVVPRWVVYTGRHLQRPMMGLDPPLGVYTHVGGIDLIRDGTSSRSSRCCGRAPMRSRARSGTARTWWPAWWTTPCRTTRAGASSGLAASWSGRA